MILCIGEILVDLIGLEKDGQTNYSVYAGGAPFNVACGIKNFKGKVGFIGNVGNDIMGKYLLDFAKIIDFDKLLLSIDNNHNTTLAFVKNDENGERSFSFYRKNSADYFIKKEYLDEIKYADIIHLGSLMLSNLEGREVADLVIEKCKYHNKLISFDINFRDDIYPSVEDAISIYKEYASKANIVKYSLEELQLFTTQKDIYQALVSIANPNQLIFLTLGKQGSVCYFNEVMIKAPAIKVKPIDTTGAGDAFFAAVLTKIDSIGFNNLVKDKEIIKEVLKFANISGALTTTKKGAIDALPSIDEVNKLL